MSLSMSRATCHACHEPLPRAAFHRCPFCRAEIKLAIVPDRISCRRCNKVVPRAHAGQCPSCVVTMKRTGDLKMIRKQIV